MIIETLNTCKVPVADGRIKKYQISNIYISMDTPVIDTAVFFLWHLNTAGDSVRKMDITVENITIEHIYSHMDVLRIGSYAPSLTLKNIVLNNVS